MGSARYMFIFVDDEVNKKVRPSLDKIHELGVGEESIRVIDKDYETRLENELKDCLEEGVKPVVFLDKMLSMEIGNKIFKDVLLGEGRLMNQEGVLVCNSTHNQRQYQEMAPFFSDIKWKIEIGPAKDFIDLGQEEGGLFCEYGNSSIERE